METDKIIEGKLTELRKMIPPGIPVLIKRRWDVASGIFLVSALVCSIVTAFSDAPAWPAAVAVVLLGISLVCWRVSERSLKV